MSAEGVRRWDSQPLVPVVSSGAGSPQQLSVVVPAGREGPMSRKLPWFCSTSRGRLAIAWGAGEERTISVEGEAAALENYSAAGIKRRKQN